MVPSCAEGGVFGILPGTIGTIQATESIKVILGIGETLTGKLLLYNALDMSFEFVRLRKNPKCKVCGKNPVITSLIDYENFCGTRITDLEVDSAGDDWDITAREMADQLERIESIKIIDVREPHELEISKIPGSEVIPLGELAFRISELDSSEEIILVCKSGIRSTRALEILLGAGFTNINNLKGGINAWAQEIDPSLPIY